MRELKKNEIKAVNGGLLGAIMAGLIIYYAGRVVVGGPEL